MPNKNLPNSIQDAVTASYSESLRYYDGYLVINRARCIVWADIGVQKRILRADRDDLVGSTLMPFLPAKIKPLHDKWVDAEFRKIDEAIKLGVEYTGRYMAVAQSETKARYIEAYDAEGIAIRIGIEFMPLVWMNKESKEICLVAFISLDPSQQVQERLISQSSEASAVIKIAKAETAILYVNKGSALFNNLYTWILDNPLKSTKHFIAFLLGLVIVGTGTVSIGFTTWFFFFRKGPTINELNVTSPSPLRPEHAKPSKKPDSPHTTNNRSTEIEY